MEKLMGGSDSVQKQKVVEKISSGVLSAHEHSTVNATETVKAPISDEELLDELFPQTKSESASHVDNPEPSLSKECEVEWALMALEEHEQLGRQSRSVSPTKGDADFVSLFEEMYGDDAAISLSTPSPQAKLDKKRQGNGNTKEAEEVQGGDSLSSKDVEGVEDKLPGEFFAMVQQIHKKAIELHLDFVPHAEEICSSLCLPRFSCKPDLNSCVEAICCLEECLNNEDLVNSFAPTRNERLELILTAFDDKIGALPYTLTMKWAKVIHMLPLLAKMKEQTKPSAPPDPVVDPPALQIATTTPPPPKLKDKESPLQGWATFHPEKMPARRCESMKIAKPTPTTALKPRVQIRQYLPSKLRKRCKVYNPADSELTFRPKINKSSRNNGEQSEGNFTARMEKDISLRRSQKLQQQQKREEHEREEAESVTTPNLIAKGSQRILLKNGMWTESFEERLLRLAKHRTNRDSGDSRSKRKRQRHQQRKREAAAVASKACESLYQRGIEQRKREQERLQDDNCDLEFQRNRPKISNRSLRVMKTRIRQELVQLCMDSIVETEQSDSEDESSSNSSVTFIQFSCALLYFGFVPDLNTLWEGQTDEDQVTLLWHSWAVFTRDDGVIGSKLAMTVLERVLFAVIIGEKAGSYSVLHGREAQVLLRLYRANYYARKHTQLKEEPKQSTTTKSQGRSQANKRGKSQRLRVRYTMHGKPVRGTDTPDMDVLSERERLMQEKMEHIREEKAKQELEGCTFHPRINPRPSERFARHSANASSSTISTFERLYSDAFQRQNNVLEKYLEAKSHREEQEKRECRVHPSYVNGLTIEERLENLHVALAGNALPVGFQKKINAMRTATEMKAMDEQLKEQRLYPAQFKRAKDGRTIVLPFQFATEIRATMTSKLNKQHTTTAATGSRDHVMKSLRPTAQTIPQTDENEAELCLDIHLSPSETRQLYLNVHEDPRDAVERFAQRFSLTNTQRHFLVQLVEARLEQFAECSI
ncbi:hypothetical protein P3T76_002040 [Phytophthora citrophthora]|uniref:Uncharacterized protein n=1 Tax=Phytophthora citrophthora TaxID=4793 RepID=A0AAD9GXC4_9STRA|nr:hypothetical protein P3T76_002040 [Phytophthora citrophthora]